jgi:hypothetical protein
LEELMTNQPVPPLIDFFKDIKDPRVERNKDYPLLEVIVITLLAIMAFAEGWEDIETYGNAKEGWLRKFLPLEHGIPKHDVYRGCKRSTKTAGFGVPAGWFLGFAAGWHGKMGWIFLTH